MRLTYTIVKAPFDAHARQDKHLLNAEKTAKQLLEVFLKENVDDKLDEALRNKYLSEYEINVPKLKQLIETLEHHFRNSKDYRETIDWLTETIDELYNWGSEGMMVEVELPSTIIFVKE